MPVEPAGTWIPRNDDDQGTNQVGARRADALLFKQASPGVAQQGRMGADHLVVSGTSTWGYQVGPGGLVMVRQATGGVYRGNLPTAVIVPTTPGSGVNPRIDRIYVKQPDPALDGPGVDVGLIVDVAVGTPASAPLPPALPAGAVELRRALVPAGAGNTSTALFSNELTVTGLNVPEPVQPMVKLADMRASNIAGFTLDDLFTAEYATYKLRFHVVTAAPQQVTLRMRKTEADHVPGSGYGMTRQYTTGPTSSVTAYTTTSGWVLNGLNGSQHFGDFTFSGITNPAEQAMGVGQCTTIGGAVGNCLCNWAGHYGGTTTFDGLRLHPGAGVFTSARLIVEGYR